MSSTIFPNSNQDLDRCIALYADPCSRVALSGVNKAAYAMLSNIVFKHLFMQEHPLIKGDIEAHALDLLCVCHPNNCWKVASCVFTTAIFQPNGSFLREPFPLFQSSLQSKKKQTEIEIKNLCGSYFADPDSQIDQAWKAYKKSEKAIEESTMALPSIEKCDNFRSGNLEVTQAYDKIKLSCSEEDALIIQMAIISFARCFHRVRLFQAMGRLAQANFTPSEMYKLDEAFKFDIDIMLELKEYIVPVKIKRASLVENKMEELELDADDVLALFDEDLVEEHFILFKFVFNKYFELGLQCLERGEFRANYNNIEGERKKCSEKLDKINRCLNLLGPSERGSIIAYISIAMKYELCLRAELDYLMRIEKFKIVENALNECRSSIDKAKKYPENLFFLNSIRDFINLCSYDVKTDIWKTLYERCAHGIIEDQWSENHYGEFLPELEKILGQIFRNNSIEYQVRENIMKRDYALGRFENLIDLFIKYGNRSRGIEIPPRSFSKSPGNPA